MTFSEKVETTSQTTLESMLTPLPMYMTQNFIQQQQQQSHEFSVNSNNTSISQNQQLNNEYTLFNSNHKKPYNDNDNDNDNANADNKISHKRRKMNTLKFQKLCDINNNTSTHNNINNNSNSNSNTLSSSITLSTTTTATLPSKTAAITPTTTTSNTLENINSVGNINSTTATSNGITTANGVTTTTPISSSNIQDINSSINIQNNYINNNGTYLTTNSNITPSSTPTPTSSFNNDKSFLHSNQSAKINESKKSLLSDMLRNNNPENDSSIKKSSNQLIPINSLYVNHQKYFNFMNNDSDDDTMIDTSENYYNNDSVKNRNNNNNIINQDKIEEIGSEELDLDSSSHKSPIKIPYTTEDLINSKLIIDIPIKDKSLYWNPGVSDSTLTTTTTATVTSSTTATSATSAITEIANSTSKSIIIGNNKEINNENIKYNKGSSGTSGSNTSSSNQHQKKYETIGNELVLFKPMPWEKAIQPFDEMTKGNNLSHSSNNGQVIGIGNRNRSSNSYLTTSVDSSSYKSKLKNPYYDNGEEINKSIKNNLPEPSTSINSYYISSNMNNVCRNNTESRNNPYSNNMYGSPPSSSIPQTIISNSSMNDENNNNNNLNTNTSLDMEMNMIEEIPNEISSCFNGFNNNNNANDNNISEKNVYLGSFREKDIITSIEKGYNNIPNRNPVDSNNNNNDISNINNINNKYQVPSTFTNNENYASSSLYGNRDSENSRNYSNTQGLISNSSSPNYSSNYSGINTSSNFSNTFNISQSQQQQQQQQQSFFTQLPIYNTQDQNGNSSLDTNQMDIDI